MTYTIYQEDNLLMIKRQRFVDCILAPTHADKFLFEGEDPWGGRITMLLEFSWKEKDVIIGFKISSPNALNIWFEKIVTPPSIASSYTAA